LHPVTQNGPKNNSEMNVYCCSRTASTSGKMEATTSLKENNIRHCWRPSLRECPARGCYSIPLCYVDIATRQR